jgi:signal transduction histidine kinase
VLRPTLLNLNTLVYGLMHMIDRMIGSDVRVELSLDDAACTVQADAGQLEQVLMNLAVNARDAMPDGGVLRISTRTAVLEDGIPDLVEPLPPGRYTILTVADTGTGMSRDVTSHIFEPFFTTKGVGKGTGLGLAMVYGIVKQSGGHIAVSSAPGEGTTFTIALPAACAEDGVESTPDGHADWAG